MKGFIDIHTHIIPNVDDGAKSIEESKQMLQKSYDQGVRTIIATPHYKPNRYTVHGDELVKSFEIVKKLASEIDDEFQVYLGNEVFNFNDIIDKLDNKEIYSMADSDYILVEFLPNESYKEIRDCLYKLQMSGYLPIIAHIERYKNIVSDFKNVVDLFNMGIYIQVNVSNIIDKKSLKTRFFIRKLIKNNMIHFVATDMHNTTTRSSRMEECYKYLCKKYGTDYAETLLIKNPEKIIQKKYL
ncbi:CpsB/CapC family capsule biosynthesis tyrosine phosphatase [Intestinibacter sp.]